eukprot:TRINITY_DN16769_c0_g1_i1.p1 TRINITY_DN16769_c0_g1~~TRINITY_DN16769_c0_g1_i1.p1  ORF type:complete len:2816 (-),score=557.46 TRINITY_DN16769_c0_g1_i1:303-8750(-)
MRASYTFTLCFSLILLVQGASGELSQPDASCSTEESCIGSDATSASGLLQRKTSKVAGAIRATNEEEEFDAADSFHFDSLPGATLNKTEELFEGCKVKNEKYHWNLGEEDAHSPLLNQVEELSNSSLQQCSPSHVTLRSFTTRGFKDTCCPLGSKVCAGCAEYGTGAGVGLADLMGGKCAKCAGGFIERSGACKACADTAGWTNKDGKTCYQLSVLECSHAKYRGVSSNEACCKCGGGALSATPFGYPDSRFIVGEDLSIHPMPRTANRYAVDQGCSLGEYNLTLDGSTGHVTYIKGAQKPKEPFEVSCKITAYEAKGIVYFTTLKVSVDVLSYGTTSLLFKPGKEYKLQKAKGHWSHLKVHCSPTAPWLSVTDSQGLKASSSTAVAGGVDNVKDIYQGQTGTICEVSGSYRAEGAKTPTTKKSKVIVVRPKLLASLAYPTKLVRNAVGEKLAPLVLPAAPEGIQVPSAFEMACSDSKFVFDRVLGVGSYDGYPILELAANGQVTVDIAPEFAKLFNQVRSGKFISEISVACKIYGIFPDPSLVPIKTDLTIKIRDSTCWVEETLKGVKSALGGKASSASEGTCRETCRDTPSCSHYIWAGRKCQTVKKQANGGTIKAIAKVSDCSTSSTCREVKSSTYFHKGTYCPVGYDTKRSGMVYLKQSKIAEETIYLHRYKKSLDGHVSGCSDGNWVLERADKYDFQKKAKGYFEFTGKILECLGRSEPDYATLPCGPPPNITGALAKATVQPMIVDDPATPEPADHWLHPCDCAPKAWGDKPPVDPSAFEMEVVDSKDGFIPAPLEIVSGQVACPARNLLPDGVHYATENDALEAATCEAKCRDKENCKFFWHGTQQSAITCRLYSGCDSLVNEYGLDGSLTSLPRTQACLVSNPNDCWASTMRREALSVHNTHQGFWYWDLHADCDAMLLMGGHGINACARPSYRPPNSHKWYHKKPVKNKYEHGQTLDLSCWSQRYQGVRANSQMNKEQLTCVNGNWFNSASQPNLGSFTCASCVQVGTSGFIDQEERNEQELYMFGRFQMSLHSEVNLMTSNKVFCMHSKTASKGGGVPKGASWLRGMVAWYKSENAGPNWKSSVGAYTGRSTKGRVKAYTSQGHGAASPVRYIFGRTGESFNFGHVLRRTNTVCSITRYLTTEAQGRILTGSGWNWLQGHWSGQVGVVHAQRWQTRTARNKGSTNWVTVCSSSGSRQVLVDGQNIGTNTGTGGGNMNLVINSHTREFSDWAVMEVMTWSRVLSNSEMQGAHTYLLRKLHLKKDMSCKYEIYNPPELQRRYSNKRDSSSSMLDSNGGWCSNAVSSRRRVPDSQSLIQADSSQFDDEEILEDVDQQVGYDELIEGLETDEELEQDRAGEEAEAIHAEEPEAQESQEEAHESEEKSSSEPQESDELVEESANDTAKWSRRRRDRRRRDRRRRDRRRRDRRRRDRRRRDRRRRARRRRISHGFKSDWLEMDLKSDQWVGGVVVQGKAGTSSWPTSFKVQYKLSRSRGYSTVDAVFTGSNSATQKAKAYFQAPVKARYIRITEWTFKQPTLCARAAVILCTKQLVNQMNLIETTKCATNLRIDDVTPKNRHVKLVTGNSEQRCLKLANVDNRGTLVNDQCDKDDPQQQIPVSEIPMLFTQLHQSGATGARYEQGLTANFYFSLIGVGRCQFPDFSLRTADYSKRDGTVQYAAATSWPGLRNNDNFAATWKGFLKIISAGTYDFRIEADDNAQLKLNGKVVATGCRTSLMETGNETGPVQAVATIEVAAADSDEVLDEDGELAALIGNDEEALEESDEEITSEDPEVLDEPEAPDEPSDESQADVRLAEEKMGEADEEEAELLEGQRDELKSQSQWSRRRRDRRRRDRRRRDRRRRDRRRRDRRRRDRRRRDRRRRDRRRRSSASTRKTMKAGMIPLELTYIEYGGMASMKLSYKGPDTQDRWIVIPPSALAHLEESGSSKSLDDANKQGCVGNQAMNSVLGKVFSPDGKSLGLKCNFAPVISLDKPVEIATERHQNGHWADWWTNMENWEIGCGDGKVLTTIDTFYVGGKMKIKYFCGAIAGIGACTDKWSTQKDVSSWANGKTGVLSNLAIACPGNNLLKNLNFEYSVGGKWARFKYSCCETGAAPVSFQALGPDNSAFDSDEGIYCPKNRVEGRWNFAQQKLGTWQNIGTPSTLAYNRRNGLWCVGGVCAKSPTTAVSPEGIKLASLDIGPVSDYDGNFEGLGTQVSKEKAANKITLTRSMAPKRPKPPKKPKVLEYEPTMPKYSDKCVGYGDLWKKISETVTNEEGEAHAETSTLESEKEEDSGYKDKHPCDVAAGAGGTNGKIGGGDGKATREMMPYDQLDGCHTRDIQRALEAGKKSYTADMFDSGLDIASGVGGVICSWIPKADAEPMGFGAAWSGHDICNGIRGIITAGISSGFHYIQNDWDLDFAKEDWADCNPLQTNFARLFCDIHCARDAAVRGDRTIIRNLKRATDVTNGNLDMLAKWIVKTAQVDAGWLGSKLDFEGAMSDQSFGEIKKLLKTKSAGLVEIQHGTEQMLSELSGFAHATSYSRNSLHSARSALTEFLDQAPVLDSEEVNESLALASLESMATLHGKLQGAADKRSKTEQLGMKLERGVAKMQEVASQQLMTLGVYKQYSDLSRSIVTSAANAVDQSERHFILLSLDRIWWKLRSTLDTYLDTAQDEVTNFKHAFAEMGRYESCAIGYSSLLSTYTRTMNLVDRSHQTLRESWHKGSNLIGELASTIVDGEAFSTFFEQQGCNSTMAKQTLQQARLAVNGLLMLKHRFRVSGLQEPDVSTVNEAAQRIQDSHRAAFKQC